MGVRGFRVKTSQKIKMFCFCFSSGDQAGAEEGAEVFFSSRHVVQVSAGSLLRTLVHLPAHVREGGERQGAGAAHGVRRPQTHGEP